MPDETTSRRMLRALGARDLRVKEGGGDKSLRAYRAVIEGHRSLAATRALPQSPSIRQAGGNIIGRDSHTGQFLTPKTAEASAPPASPPNMRAFQPIESAADLGPIIRNARKRMKLSQEEFAIHAKVGRRFPSELEGGKSSVEFNKVLACARGRDRYFCTAAARLMRLLNVWLECVELPIGKLIASDEGALSFHNADSWIETRANHPLSLSLPLEEMEFGDVRARLFRQSSARE